MFLGSPARRRQMGKKAQNFLDYEDEEGKSSCPEYIRNEMKLSERITSSSECEEQEREKEKKAYENEVGWSMLCWWINRSEFLARPNLRFEKRCFFWLAIWHNRHFCNLFCMHTKQYFDDKGQGVRVNSTIAFCINRSTSHTASSRVCNRLYVRVKGSTSLIAADHEKLQKF